MSPDNCSRADSLSVWRLGPSTGTNQKTNDEQIQTCRPSRSLSRLSTPSVARANHGAPPAPRQVCFVPAQRKTGDQRGEVYVKVFPEGRRPTKAPCCEGKLQKTGQRGIYAPSWTTGKQGTYSWRIRSYRIERVHRLRATEQPPLSIGTLRDKW